jgi:hypothetical protein
VWKAKHLLRNKGGDKFKTAFRTPNGQFEYLVMVFRLANALATFQTYIKDGLLLNIEDFSMC